MSVSRSRTLLVLALLALWAQALWPPLSVMAAPRTVVLCTGAGAQVVPDPLAPAPRVHDCPCCMVQPVALPLPAAPRLVRAAAPAPVAYAVPVVGSPAQPAYRLARGRAPPAA